jgi:hypothetical protein
LADFTLSALTRAEIAVCLLLWRDTKSDGTAQTSQADLARRAQLVKGEVLTAAEDAVIDHQGTPLAEHIAAYLLK